MKRSHIGRSLCMCVCLLTAATGAALFVNTLLRLPRSASYLSAQTAFPALLTIGLLLPLLLVGYGLLVKHGAQDRAWTKWLLLALIAAGQLALLLALRPVPYTDKSSTAETAAKMLELAVPRLPSQNGYFERYGNNYPFTLLEYFYFRALSVFGVTDFWPWTLAANALLLDAGLMLMARLLTRLRGKKAGFAFLYICVFSPYTYLCACTCYTTTLCVFFVAAQLWLLYRLYLAIRDGDRSVWGIGAAFGITAALGAEIRVVSLISLIAAGICALLRRLCRGKPDAAFRRRLGRGMLVALAAALCCVLCVSALIAYYVPASMREMNFPVTHWIFMSFNPDKGYGGYVQEDDDLTFATAPQERVALHLSLLRQRFSQMGAAGLTRRLWDKFNRTWSDCWDNLRTAIYSTQRHGRVYLLLAGEDSAAFACWFQCCLLAMYLPFLLSALVRIWKRKYDTLYLLLSVTMLGGVLFHLIWEASGLYSVCLLPCAAMILAMWMAENDTYMKPAYFGMYAVCLTVALKLAPLPCGHEVPSIAETVSSRVLFRSLNIEYQVPDVNTARRTLRQSFAIESGFAFHQIALVVQPTGQSGEYLFSLYDAENTLLYSQAVSADMSLTPSIEGSYWLTVPLPADYGTGEYYFTLTGTEDAEGEPFAFICRESRIACFNTSGCLLIDGQTPEQGRSNLIFDVSAFLLEDGEK